MSYTIIKHLNKDGEIVEYKYESHYKKVEKRKQKKSSFIHICRKNKAGLKIADIQMILDDHQKEICSRCRTPFGMLIKLQYLLTDEQKEKIKSDISFEKDQKL